MSDDAQSKFEELKAKLESLPPRRVRHASFREAWIPYLLYLGLLIFFCKFVVEGLYDVIPYYAPKYGLPAQATVIGKETFYTKDSRGHLLKVKFSDQEKRIHESYVDVDPSVYDHFRIGDITPIHFLKSLPRYPDLDQYPRTIAGTIFFGIAFIIVFWLIPGGLFWVFSHEKYFLTYGIITPGKFVDRLSPQVDLSYVYNGETYTKKIPRGQVSVKGQIGDILVLVDPEKPSSFWVCNETFYWKLV